MMRTRLHRLSRQLARCRFYTAPSRPISAIDELFTGHCKDDNLDAAERLFLTWMRHFDKLEGLRALVDAVGDRESLKKNSEYKLGNVPPVEELKNNFPSMDSWHSLMSMYAGRHAGYSCKAVFDFLRLLDQRLILIKDTATDDHVMLNGYKIPLNVKADDKIYKDYIRALCGTESFKTAFGVLKEMIIDKKMEPDGHVIASLLKMVNKPGLVRDDAVPQVCNLTVELIRSMHHLDQVSRESNSEQPVSKTRSSDACLVLNVLVSVMCNRGYVIMALETVRKLQAQGFETDHITIEVLIRTLTLVEKCSTAIELFNEQRDKYTRNSLLLQETGKTDSRLQRSYHMISLGLRKENRLKDLAVFMLQNGRFVMPDSN